MLLTLGMDIKSKYSFFLGNKASFTVGALSDLKKKDIPLAWDKTIWKENFNVTQRKEHTLPIPFLPVSITISYELHVSGQRMRHLDKTEKENTNNS